MSESKHTRPPTSRPAAGTAGQPAVQTPGSRGPGQPPGATGSGARSGRDAAAGKIVHDYRGNAVWDWLKETGRNAIESTSRLLRKLEAPELKMEDKKDEELRLTDDNPGGGYDPYNQRQRPRGPGKK
jgi:hypothetical protein